MKNPFKSIAAALDRAISGGEVDVIELAEKPVDAGGGETPSVASVLGVAVDTAGEAGEAPAVETTEVQAAVEIGEVAEGAGETASVAAVIASAADAGVETPGMASVPLAEIEQLRADAAEWLANKAELAQLREWKANGSKAVGMTHVVDAADAVVTKTRKVSAQTQAAIDLQEKMEAQAGK